MLKNYKDLKVWQKSYGLCLDIYRITRKFPKEERYGLTSQNIGYGSNCELETQVLLSGDLGYVEAGKLAELIEEDSRG
jgi:hypothetical protein